ncbi:shikimate dehydrogenase [Variovorax sp. PCZ-1]|uniref:shikimate dehydrogenase family protein n=1 Tax=Variovorax sp. PCZ-1 TaxID=2835533 RepID=UPI001BCBFE99|nr:shikimate dehydrogenase [Variovorax sp. PCZ-1]MBS7806436.1 shikimate dehydrogenase [Variovorax sp. PCZ-1]
MRIDGNIEIIAHIGWPTYSFKAPLIYNPYFEQAGINAMVTPMGCKPEHFPEFLRNVFHLENVRGALITMPHKVSVMDLLDVISPAARVAGACNAVKRGSDGKLYGDMFDGEGFVRGVQRKDFVVEGKRALIVGAGGVGSAIVASLAHAGLKAMTLYDVDATSCDALADRIRANFPHVRVCVGSNDPAGFDLVVNATPLGMKKGDPLPLDVSRLDANTFVGEVVMAQEITAFLAAARARGCRTQVGTDMLYEQIPAYLEFFGLPSTTAEHLREVSLA